MLFENGQSNIVGKSQLNICSRVKKMPKKCCFLFKVCFLVAFFPPLPPTPPSALGGPSSEGHELKLPLGLPFGHPDRVGGVLRHLHDADGERRLISLVDMVSHYLSRGKGRKGDNNKRGS